MAQVSDFYERMSQARCLCKAEKRMIHRISNAKAVEVCDVTKEVASTGLSKIRRAHMSHLRGGEPIGKNRCSGCGLTFGSLDAFDAHLLCIFSRGERRCISVSEIQGLGMVRNTKGWWIRNIFNGVTPTSGSEDEEERKEVFAAAPANC